MSHPPGPPQHAKPSPQDQPWWTDRHPALSILLQILTIPILGAAAFFLWIFGAEKYAMGAGVLLIVLVVTMITTPGHNAFGQDPSAKKPPAPRP
jgi:hypothetical protein